MEGNEAAILQAGPKEKRDLSIFPACSPTLFQTTRKKDHAGSRVLKLKSIAVLKRLHSMFGAIFCLFVFGNLKCQTEYWGSYGSEVAIRSERNITQLNHQQGQHIERINKRFQRRNILQKGNRRHENEMGTFQPGKKRPTLKVKLSSYTIFPT